MFRIKLRFVSTEPARLINLCRLVSEGLKAFGCSYVEVSSASVVAACRGALVYSGMESGKDEMGRIVPQIFMCVEAEAPDVVVELAQLATLIAREAGVKLEIIPCS